MANRRMFSKSITNSSNFLMMSQSAQNLYFHLGMNADDDGFCEHFTVMRMTESKPDDLRALVERGFVFIFDQKVLIIKDWKENNYIQADRYTPSKYLETYKKEILALSAGNSCIQDVYKADTQVRLGKVRLENKKTNKKTGSLSSLNESSKPLNPPAKFDRAWLDNFIAKNDMEEAQRIASVPSLEGLVTAQEIMETAKRMPNWCDANGKTYKNWRSAIMDWAEKGLQKKKKELEERKIEMKKNGAFYVEDL